MTTLPSAKQIWSHSTCSTDDHSKALEDSTITAIEADIVFGTYDDGSGHIIREQLEPIMAHPPNTTSDLSFNTFLRMATSDSGVTGKEMKKHLKFDFKDFDAIEPALRDVRDLQICQSHGKTIFLNADVLPGPMYRDTPPSIGGEAFISTCMRALGDVHKHCAYSLGWKVDPRSSSGYLSSDVEAMKTLILDQNLLQLSRGVVLAVSARVLSKNLIVFESILQDLPGIQLLVFTGTGEPPISTKQIDSIKSHFHSIGFTDKVGFDCKVASSPVMGIIYDFAVQFSGWFMDTT